LKNKIFKIKTFCFSVMILLISAAGQLTAQTDSVSVLLPFDTLKITHDSTAVRKVVELPKDTLPKKKKENAIDAKIDYTAQDSIVLFANGTGFLYGAGNMKYKEINLKADYIRVKMDSSILFARGITDSLGVVKGKPEFSEGERKFISKELSYNLKTKRAFVRQAVTQEGEGYIISDYTKMNADRLLSIQNAKYTTCDNHDDPHFYLKISKGKVKTGDYIVAGPSQMYVADMPLPLVLPFGYFPFNKTYSSGLLMPSYADDMQRGLGLIHGGYYFAFNDYVDAELRSEIYTKGTWALSLNSTYLKRYRYNGRINIDYRNDVMGEKEMRDYSQSKNLRIGWSHSQDAKANPYTTFSASVNFSTSGYNRSNINNYARPEITSQNQTASNISFSKRFPRIPSLGITSTFYLEQRTRDSTLSVKLPDVNISYSSTKPFKRKNAMGNERWYEKITFRYSGTLSNSIGPVNENLFFKKNLIKDWRNGIKHNIPVDATFNAFGFVNITPTINYTERWYTRSIKRSWDKVNQKEVLDTTNGFKRVYDFSVGVSAGTKIYGFFVPNQKLFGWTKIAMIRHVITPSVGLSWQPDFGDPMWNYYGSYIEEKTDPNNPGNYIQKEVQYSYYEGSLYGTPSRGKSQSLNFSLDNNLEMKLRNDADTTGKSPYKVVSLIDQFSLGGNYNFAADSIKLSNISANLRLKIGKIPISFSTSFDPYDYAVGAADKDYPQGRPVRINTFTWKNGRFPRWSGINWGTNGTLDNDTYKKIKKFLGLDKDSKTTDGDTNNDSENANQNNSSNNNQQNNNSGGEIDSDGYEKVDIRWSIGWNYTITYGPSFLPADFMYDKMRYKNRITTSNWGLSLNLSLGKNWNGSTSFSYDALHKNFTTSSFSVRRNLHCWSMSASFVPFGWNKNYSFHIGVNASMLQDLKYDRQSRQSNQISWY